MAAPSSKSRVTRRVYALGSPAAILFGYDNGIISAAILFIPHELPLTPLLKGAVVSSTALGAMVGALGSGPAADRLGRQRVLLAAGVVFTGYAAAGVIVWWCVPETKQRSLESLERAFRRGARFRPEG
ncbi:MFS transporter [Saccharopolyspora sp. 5N102]|uniref:MFS transporter n=1 Tax=Saccharopolyspora sp. 5N102 TaxID=3375155 RepID=UPI0037BB4ABE